MIKFNVYALNWNESRIIPAFLYHYRQANRIIVYDNESTDNSVSLIKDAGREVVSFNTNNTFDDQINIDLKNRIWKDAREENIDFVLVQDLDEFIYFPKWPDNLLQALFDYKANGITCAKCSGYNIVCTDAEWNALLKKLHDVKYDLTTNQKIHGEEVNQTGVAQLINRGYRFINEDKVLLFNPQEIIETNYSPGAHSWAPEGNIVYSPDAPALLHYKYIGKKYCQNMMARKRDRLSEKNKMNLWGWEYLVSDEEITERLSKLEEKNYDLITNAIKKYIEKCKPFYNLLTTIIILERDWQRVLHVNEKCIPNLINYRIEAAVDGADNAAILNFQKAYKININIDYVHTALMGALGCSFSHMQAWDFQIRNSISHMIILEDDALLEKDFYLDTMNICSELDTDYDFVYLFVYPDHYKNGDEVIIEGMNFINHGYKTWCTVAYLLSLKGAKKLWNRLQNNLSDNVDNIISEMIESKSLIAYSAVKQFVKCSGQSVPWDDDATKLISNIWSSANAKDFLL